MKYIIILSGILLTTSCIGQTRQKEKREHIPNPEKYVHDGYLEQPDSLKAKFKPDKTIGQISLMSPENVDNFLGEKVMERLIIGNELPSSSVVSSDSKQRLTFYFDPGGVKKNFSEFHLSYVNKKSREEFTTTNKEFSTESGIKLGMTMGNFRVIKGEPDSISNGKTTEFYYKIDDFKNSEFLKRYNMPIYYACYKFKNGYLNEFKFGFKYP